MSPIQENAFDITLPMRSADLGRMPGHDPFPTVVPATASTNDEEWVFPDMSLPYDFSQPKEPVNPMVDDATFELWAKVPGGMDLDDWASYLAGVGVSQNV